MIKLALRFTALILLILIVVMDDFPFYEKMKDSNNQLVLAIIVIIFIYYDIVFGFIMAMILLLIYYEIYKKIIIIKDNDTKNIINGDDILSDNKECALFYKKDENEIIQLNYISEQHLLAAQNNVFDIENYKTEIRGIEHGFNNEKVYGIQGLDSQHVNFIGYNKEELYSEI